MFSVTYTTSNSFSRITGSSYEDCFKQLSSIERICKICNNDFKIIDKEVEKQYINWKK